MAFQLTSSAFRNRERIPDRYTCVGQDVSPPLSWSDAPAGTRSFALLCDDPDAPSGTWHHWAMFDIPATTASLPEGFATSEQARKLRHAINDFRRNTYGGPCPPPGHGVHHYYFRLLALDVERLDLGSKAGSRDVETVAAPHVLGMAVLIGTYSR